MSKLLKESFESAIQKPTSFDASGFLEKAAQIDGLKIA